MKLSKSTTILINVALVLLIAILVKSLIAVPKSVSAEQTKEYLVKTVAGAKEAQQVLSELAQQGWTFTFAWYNGKTVLIMER